MEDTLEEEVVLDITWPVKQKLLLETPGVEMEDMDLSGDVVEIITPPGWSVPHASLTTANGL